MVHPPCTEYTIIFSSDAKKDLKKLDPQKISKVFEKTRQLISSNTEHLNIKKIRSKVLLYRLRMGNYRIIYQLEHEKIIVHIVAIGHRKDIYTNLLRRIKNHERHTWLLKQAS